MLDACLSGVLAGNIFSQKQKEKAPEPFDSGTFLGPSEKIRTSGLLNPIPKMTARNSMFQLFTGEKCRVEACNVSPAWI